MSKTCPLCRGQYKMCGQVQLENSLEEVRTIIHDWLEGDNIVRPHAALGGVPPLSYELTDTT